MFESSRTKETGQIEIFEDPTQFNRDHYHNKRRETNRALRNKKRLFEGKIE